LLRRGADSGDDAVTAAAAATSAAIGRRRDAARGGRGEKDTPPLSASAPSGERGSGAAKWARVGEAVVGGE